MRVGPDKLEAGTDLRLAQIVEIDAERLPVRELNVVPAVAGEIGEHFNGVPDIAHQHEGRRAMVGGKAVSVAFRLIPRVHHQHVPAAAHAARPAPGNGWDAEQIDRHHRMFVAAGLAGLLCFQDEAVALVEVDPAQ